MGKRVDPDVVARAAHSVYNNWLAVLGLEAAIDAAASLMEDLKHEQERREALEK